MTIQTLLRYVSSAILSALGAALLYASYLTTHSLERAIFYANLSILNGESVLSLLKPIAAIMSGGHLKPVDNYVIYSMIILGWLFLFAGIQLSIFTYKKTPLKVMASLKYWQVMDFSFVSNRKYTAKSNRQKKRNAK